MFTRHIFLAASGLAAVAALSGCSTVSNMWENTGDYIPYFLKPYRADVHQGNLVTSEMVLQLEKGMTDAQVQFLLGVPLIRDQFHQNQWDYVYYLLRGDGEQQLRRLTVYFDANRRLDHWTSDPMPDEQQADQLILGNIKTFTPQPPQQPQHAPESQSAEEQPVGEAKDEGRTESSSDAGDAAHRAP